MMIHPKYAEAQIAWQRTADCVAGQRAVKAKQTVYLPLIAQGTKYAAEDYKDYIHRALFYGATGNTADAVVGAMLRRDPTVVYPDGASKDLEEIGSADESLVSMIRSSAKELTDKGRVGHLIDATNDGLPDQPSQVFVARYTADSILNWSRGKVNGKIQLTLVVLLEVQSITDTSNIEKDGVTTKEEVRYRVLRLESVNGSWVYTQQLYKKAEGGSAHKYQLVDSFTPTMFAGRTLDFIPFWITGTSDDSNPDPSSPPLLPVADINIAHYCNSADLEHGMHYTALPTPWVKGFPKETVMQIGSRTAWATENTDADARILEFTGAGLASISAAMETKKREMSVLGARLFEDTRQAESGEALKLRQSGSRSVLASMTNSLSSTWTAILQTFWLWTQIGEPPEPISVVINTDYSLSALDPTMLNALMAQVQAGLMSWDSYYFNVEKSELYPQGRTREEESDLIAAGTPGLDSVPTSGPASVVEEPEQEVEE